MKQSNDYNMYEYLKDRDKGDNRELISFYNSKIRSNDLHREINRLGVALDGLGLVAGDNIAICLPNVPNAIISFYAANALGVPVNLIHPLVPSDLLVAQLQEVGSKVLFLLDIFYEQHREAIKSTGITCVICSAKDYLKGGLKLALSIAVHSKTKRIVYDEKILKYSDFISSGTEDILCPKRRHEGIGEEIAAYMHSSGTTGEPKTTNLSNRAVNECSYSVRTLIGDEVELGESMLMVLPLFHIFGLGVCMHTTLTAGCRCLLIPKFSPESVVRTIKKEKVTYMTGVPSMYEKIMRSKHFKGDWLKSMKCCYSGGDRLSIDIKNKFDKIMIENGSGCTLCEGYGLTEAGICTVNTKENSKIGSIGTPLGDIKVIAVGKDNMRLLSDECGEICVSGDNILSGYYGDEKTTNQVLFQDNEGVFWVKTGDYGHVSESGHVYYVDRLKRMIKVSGINVFPTEIERIIADNVPAVDKCSAVEMMYEGRTAVKLFVTMHDEYCYNSDIEMQIISVLKDKLMKYSLPRVIECLDSLPMTEIGKVDYKKLTIKEKI